MPEKSKKDGLMRVSDKIDKAEKMLEKKSGSFKDAVHFVHETKREYERGNSAELHNKRTGYQNAVNDLMYIRRDMIKTKKGDEDSLRFNARLLYDRLSALLKYKGEGKENIYRRAAMDSAQYSIELGSKNEKYAGNFKDLARKFEKKIK